jgi:hypothetical protein
MNTDFFFQFSNIWVVPGWVLLWFFPGRSWTQPIVVNLIILLLALLYSILLISSTVPFEAEAFSSLAGIKTMFGNDRLLLAGWIHYLAFDLTVALFITRDSLKIGYPVWLRIPVQFFVFMTGPLGMLIYLSTRFIYSKNITWA